MTLAKVDATVESDLGSRFGVTGYPTLKIFRKGVESGPYEGPRKADGIVKYMQKQAGPSSKELTEVSVAKKFVEGNDHVVVGGWVGERERERKRGRRERERNIAPVVEVLFLTFFSPFFISFLAIVGFFEDKAHALAAAFQQLADNAREDYKFAHTYSADVASALGAAKK